MSTTPVSPNQWIRFAQLAISSSINSTAIVIGTNLSNQYDSIRFRFEVKRSDAAPLNTLSCRIYNLAPSTVGQILSKVPNSKLTPSQISDPLGSGSTFNYGQVSLSAGYQNGAQGVIYSGQIRQFEWGRERNVDDFLDIYAADGDFLVVGKF